jgi:hypothetical protein
MKKGKLSSVLFVMLGTVLLSASFVFADDAIKACVQDARNQLAGCVTLCKEGFLAAKDDCRDIYHPCADACRATRNGCVGEVLIALETCKEENCEGPLETARDLCKVAYPKGSPERDQCIDNAQVVAFQCRDTCREGVAGDLKACRAAFKTCIKECPPASTD